ncbi:MAG: universal stress protein [Desulfobacteraceae bacterium]|jgi:nucleotide-binding universal stress UspA family protein|nr:universal stress protein [Desulfobacteraceae bacterium]
MFNIDRILVPTDFSDFSDLALGRAIDLADSCTADKAKIYLTYVWPEAPDVFKLSKYIVEGQKKIQAEMEKQCEKYFAEQIAKFPEAEKVEIETKVFQGSPYKEILDFQKKIKADMVIIGTHGDTPFEGFFFGSTSSKIIRHATCSVMIVRKPKYS